MYAVAAFRSLILEPLSNNTERKHRIPSFKKRNESDQ